MALTRDDNEERTARIDQLLEQLRLSTDHLHELAQQAVDRARAACRAAENTVEKVQAEQVARQAAKKPETSLYSLSGPQGYRLAPHSPTSHPSGSSKASHVHDTDSNR